MKQIAGAFTLASLTLLGCRPIPPTPIAPRGPTPVAASFGKTWDATIDIFAAQHISIETLDRSSGLIVPRGHAFVAESEQRYYDCGKNAFGQAQHAAAVKYNVIVRGDSARSSVQVRAFFEPDGQQAVYVSCNSTGAYESEAEALIRGRAETGR